MLDAPSFLAYQQQMRERQGQDNARSLFGIEDIPSDRQIRNLLDPVESGLLREPFWDILGRLRANDHLDSYRHVGGTLLCSMDGTRCWSYLQESERDSKREDQPAGWLTEKGCAYSKADSTFIVDSVWMPVVPNRKPKRSKPTNGLLPVFHDYRL